VTDRQTDGQTELPWHIRAIAYMLSRVIIIFYNELCCPYSAGCTASRHFGRYSFPVLLIIRGSAGLATLLKWFACQKTVTHSNISWAQHRVTSLMCPTPLPLSQNIVTYQNIHRVPHSTVVIYNYSTTYTNTHASNSRTTTGYQNAKQINY